MMEFKGTQGPWKIMHGGFRNDDGFSIGSDNATASRVKVTAECWPCTIIDQEHRDELLANARLIAAVPELLAVLMEIVATDDAAIDELKMLMGPRMESSDLTEKARAAIEKALGESS
jgi:hypothetical protein